MKHVGHLSTVLIRTLAPRRCPGSIEARCLSASSRSGSVANGQKDHPIRLRAAVRPVQHRPLHLGDELLTQADAGVAFDRPAILNERSHD